MHVILLNLKLLISLYLVIGYNKNRSYSDELNLQCSKENSISRQRTLMDVFYVGV